MKFDSALASKSQVLLEALPYIKKYRGKRMVIKLSGAVLDDPLLKEEVIKDIVLLRFVGIKPIVVHGGGQQVNKVMKKLGKESVFSNGKRVTNDETMEIVQMVLVGKINKNIVSIISKYGGEAIGISGQDGQLLLAKKIVSQGVDLGRVGEIEKINISLLDRIYGSEIIPVVAPVALDKDNQPLNVNADEVATAIAAMLCVEKLVFISDVRGVWKTNPKSTLNKTKDASNLSQRNREIYEELNLKDVEMLIREKKVTDGMIVKLEAAQKAIKEGVRSVQIISGVDLHSLLVEIFTTRGVGTKITI